VAKNLETDLIICYSVDMETVSVHFGKHKDGIWTDGSMKMSKQCYYCKHLVEGSRFVCAAFPKGIPERILSGQHDHTESYEGDHGIRYEPESPSL
jgi:hypothetical protein